MQPVLKQLTNMSGYPGGIMIDSKLKNYEEKVFYYIDYYEEKIKQVVYFFELLLFTLSGLLEKTLEYNSMLFKMFSKFFRYTTYPLHWIMILILIRPKKETKLTDLPIFKVGAHYWYGKPGSGKSTSVYHSMMDYAYHTGKCSYTTEMMETPRTNYQGIEYYYHQLFEPSDFYQDGEQIQGFDEKRFNMIIYEEMLTRYHQRNNSKSSFNNEVLPMVASMGSQRHQGMHLFYFISQLPKNDIAIMQMLTGYHIPKIKKKFDYKYWLQTGRIKFSIAGWHITSFEVSPNGNDFVLTNKTKWFYENRHNEDMEYFNRLNLKANFDKLTKYKGRGMS